MLTEQARVNQAVDDGDVNNLISDFQGVAGELVGLTGAETVAATTVGNPPHKWDDAQTAWNYFTWA